jgi:hypothetical protein
MVKAGVGCSRLTDFVILLIGVESRFFACKIGFDASNILRKVS